MRVFLALIAMWRCLSVCVCERVLSCDILSTVVGAAAALVVVASLSVVANTVLLVVVY